MTRIDTDGENGTKESLEITWNSNTNIKVVIAGYYGPYDPYSSTSSMDGHIEKLIFADVTYTDKNPPLPPEATGTGRTEMAASEPLTAAEGISGEEIEAEGDVAPDTHRDGVDKGKKGREAKHAKR
jgi:hypothetical protein